MAGRAAIGVASTQPIGYLSADQAFRRLRHLRDPVWLDSSATHAQGAAIHILSALPRARLSLAAHTNPEDLWAQLRAFADQLSPLAPCKNLPFCSGLIGYFGYAINHPTHKLAAKGNLDSLGQVGLYSWALVIDENRQTAELAWHPDCTPNELAEVRESLATSASTSNTTSTFRLDSAFRPSIEIAQYRHQIERIIRYLHAGDCYQVNLAQHFCATYQGDCSDAYLALRQFAPAPFSAYLGFEQKEVLSFSPERFIRLQDKRVETWPIKGTAARSSNIADDNLRAATLQSSEKNRAENLMIVDLMRNDLSRSCTPGSVQVDALYELQSFSNVHHLVSKVSAQLAPGKDAFSLLESCLPAGSITGAPKTRAMQIIEELEVRGRDAYCGAVGYISRCGGMDTSVAIRTLQADGHQLHAWGGGGVVVDSNADAEYQETLAKIRPHLDFLERMGGVPDPN